MLRQQLKDVYFAANRHIVRPNTVIARLRYRKPPADGWRLHVGCGGVYLPGMVNIDGNVSRKVDLWLDLRNPLPFPTASCSFVYCAHTLEHLYVDEAQRLLREYRRVLRVGSIARLVTPSFEHAMRIAAGHPAEDPQRCFSHANGQAIDYLFCDGQHRYAYSFEVMRDFALAAGFADVRHLAGPDGLSRKRYGPVEVGPELAGSLVVELA